MTFELTPQPLVKLPKYPHMEPMDTAIWSAYLDTDPFRDARVSYDVLVGTPALAPPDTPDNYRHMIEHLSSLRIDAVVLLHDRTLIVEIKPSASLSAIGQALGYTHLFHAKYPHYLQPTPYIVTDLARPDTPFLCGILNVALHSLGKSFALPPYD